jgi:hypothetical protein
MGGQDFVREELAAALERQITVIPVLVGGARMPGPEDLPAALALLSRHNAIEISDTRFDQDAARLSSFLRETVATEDGGRRRWWPAVAALVVVLAVAAYLIMRSGGPVVDLNGKWIAQMQTEGQRAYRIRLTFAVGGGTVSGTVDYPTGTGAIREAKLSGRQLSFHTTHVPQFASEPATIHFQGDVVGEKIHLIASDDSSVAKGIAEKMKP